MSKKSAAILEHFFKIDEDEIEKDIRCLKSNRESINNEISVLESIGWRERTASQTARYFHLQLISAHDTDRVPHNIPEFQIFRASFVAGDVRQHANRVAAEKGRLRDLRTQIEGMKKSENCHPRQIRNLMDEWAAIDTEIGSAVFSSVLRRYHFDSIVMLFEEDEDEYEVQCEIGRRILYRLTGTNLENEETWNLLLREAYGIDCQIKIQRRAEEVLNLIQGG